MGVLRLHLKKRNIQWHMIVTCEKNDNQIEKYNATRLGKTLLVRHGCVV